MHFEGKLTIGAPIERVWAFLTDPQQVSRCAPDLQSLEVQDDRHFRVVVRAGVGPVRGNFTFDVAWPDLQAPSHARMLARGKIPGSAVDLDSVMDLTPAADGGTEMAWKAEVQVSGTIASVGARLIQGVADRQMQQIFGCLRAKLEQPAPAVG